MLQYTNKRGRLHRFARLPRYRYHSIPECRAVLEARDHAVENSSRTVRLSTPQQRLAVTWETMRDIEGWHGHRVHHGFPFSFMEVDHLFFFVPDFS